MDNDKGQVIYTDGHDVTVTDKALKVKHTDYQISGITKAVLSTIRPDRWPALLVILLGIAGIVCGYLQIIPEEIDVNAEGLTNNQLAMIIGGALLVIGLIILALAKERYAVTIATAEGEKNAVVSHKREYIAQIVDALNRAFSFRTSHQVFGNTSPKRGDGPEYVTIK